MRTSKFAGSDSIFNGRFSKSVKFTSSCSKSRASSLRKSSRAVMLASAVLACAGSLRSTLAADVNATFTNTDANNNWTDAHNWNPATEPNNGNGGNNYIVDIPAAPGAADMNAAIAIDGLTVESAAQVNILNADELAIGSGTSSTLTNNGTITVNSNVGGNATDLKFSSAGVNLLTGNGSVILTVGGTQSAVTTAAGATLTVDTLQTIKGSGVISAAMTNNGTVNADNNAGTLTLQTNGMSNSNIMEATGGGNLAVDAITITNSGTIEATGTGSTVTLNSNAAISGGILSSASGDSIVSAGSIITTLENGVTVASGTHFNIVNAGQTNVSNTLTNNGTITVNSGPGGNTTVLNFNSGAILAGTGSVVLNASGGNAQLSGSLTQNAGSSITGIGEINAALTNNGTVNANVSAGTMTLLTNPMSNGGTMEATGGGNLAINGITITNSGTIQATGTGSAVTLNLNAEISGGTLTAASDDSFITAGSITATLAGAATITSGTHFNILNAGQTNVTGTLTNNGTITVNSNAGGNTTVLNFNAAGANLLTGNGSVVLQQSGIESEVTTATGSTLTVGALQTIEGAGAISAAMTNNGTIDANVSAGTMLLQTNAMSNTNIMEATGGANLNISGITVTNTGTIEATGNNGSGTNSSVTLTSATISGGTLSADPADSIISAGSLIATLESGVTVASGTHYNILNAGQTNVGNTLTNNGTITVNSNVGGNTTVLNFSSGAILAGTGIVVLNAGGGNAQLNGTVTQDAGSSIIGLGEINAALTNNGIVNANVNVNTLTLLTNPMTNGGTMEATNGGNLAVNGITVTNSGTIEATGTGSTVTLNSNAAISGGTLSSGSGDSIVSAGSITTTLENGVTVASGTHFNILNAGQTNVSNTLTNNGTITVNSNVGGNTTVLDFSSGAILAGTGSVVLNATGGNAQLNGTVTQNVGSSITGLGQINAALTNNGTVNANVSASTMTILTNPSNPMTNGGTMEATGGGNLSINGITITNTGGTIKATGNNGSGINSSVILNGTTISGGTLSTDSSGNIFGYGTVDAPTTNNGVVNANISFQTLNLNGTVSGSGTLSVTNGATLVIGTNTGGSTQGAVSVTGSGSKLNLTNNHLIINYGAGPDPAATIRSLLTSGYAAGAWTGQGIDSSTAALPANSHYALGYADGVDGVVAGLSSGQIELKYTLYGDADLDGLVTGNDFTILVSNLAKSGRTWDQGDFDYDGSVTGNDFTALVANLGKSANGADIVLPASDYAAVDAFAEANGLMTDVPEQGTLGLITIGALGTLLRRKRKNIHE
jgi:hypothetical protein